MFLLHVYRPITWCFTPNCISFPTELYQVLEIIAETITETPRSEVGSDLSGRFAYLELMMPLRYPAKNHRHPQVGLLEERNFDTRKKEYYHGEEGISLREERNFIAGRKKFYCRNLFLDLRSYRIWVGILFLMQVNSHFKTLHTINLTDPIYVFQVIRKSSRCDSISFLGFCSSGRYSCPTGTASFLSLNLLTDFPSNVDLLPTLTYLPIFLPTLTYLPISRPN